MGQTVYVDDRLDAANRMAYVSPTFDTGIYTDDENAHRFSTIQAAINWVHESDWYSDLDEFNRAAIMVYPGEYKEQLTCWDFIYLVSVVDRDTLANFNTVVLKPPDDKKTEPMLVAGADYRYRMIGFHFVADAVEHGPYAYILPEGRFHNCLFTNGSFLENSADYDGGFSFIGCTFRGATNQINLTGARGDGWRGLYFFNTWGYRSIIGDSVGLGSANLQIRDSPIGRNVVVGGNWNVLIENCRLRATRSTFDTTGYVHITNSEVSGGMHFKSNPSEVKITGCDFNRPGSGSITGADITADVAITLVEYLGNIQQNGIAGEIQILNPIKPVGADAINRYYSIQDAIDSIETEGVVELYADFASLSELTIPNNTKVTIDGKRIYSLGFSGNIVELGLGEILILNRIVGLSGGTANINGNNAEFHIHSCPCGDNTIQILATAGTGSKVHLRNSYLDGDTGHSVLQIDNVDTEFKIEYSTLKGATGQPAVEFTAEADGKFKSRYSTLIHGDGGVNAPITYTGANKVDIAIYSSALNAAWNAAHFTNLIGAANNTTDGSIDF